MSCVSAYGVEACFTAEDGTKQSIIIHNIYDSKGAVVATFYVDAEHKPVPGANASNVTVGACPASIQCLKDKFIEGGLDNTFTNWQHTGQQYLVTFDNGDTGTFAIASATGGTDQVTQMANGLGSIMPWAQTVEPFQNPNGGDLPAPSVPLNQMVARYVGFRVCPGDKVPVKVEYKSDQDPDGKTLIVQYVETRTIYIDACVDCSGNKTYLVDGKEYEPVCAIPCADSFPEVPLSVCSVNYIPGCDNMNSTDPADWVNVTRFIKDCGDGLERGYLIDEAGGLVERALVGQFVDCASGEPIPDPIPPCDDFEIVELFSMSELSGTLRSREWDLGPRPSSAMSIDSGRAIVDAFDFSQPTTTDQDWNNLSVNDTNNDNQTQDAQVVEGYILVEQPMQMRWRNGSAGYFAVEIGHCCGEYVREIEGAHIEQTRNPTSAVELVPGVHKIRMWNVDDYTNTAMTAEYSIDGGENFITDSTPPGITLSRTKPVETCKKLKVCKPSGELIGLLDGQVVDPSTCYECSKLCKASAGIWSGC